MSKQTGSRASGPRGQKKALTPDQVGYLGGLLRNECEDKTSPTFGRARRDYALFRTAICSMLRASDITRLKISDVWAENGIVRDEVLIVQRKTGRNVIVHLQEETRFAIYNWLMAAYYSEKAIGLNSGHRLFGISIRHYTTLVKQWVKRIGLDPRGYSTHSLRRTKAKEIYRVTKNLEAVRQLLGQTSLGATSAYLGIDQDDALEISKEIKL